MLYSYDIFDTVLYRFVPKSVDVFRVMEQKESVVDLWTISTPFSECRKKSEFWLRRMKNTEITIDDIYNRMHTATKIDKQALEKIQQIELETEKELSFLNAAIVNEIKAHMDAGERVILISDMYWREDAIRSILQEKDAVFSDIPIYVSCDYRSSKKRSDLFSVVSKKENCPYSSWIHVGDNRKSDYINAKKLGIQAKKIQDSTRFDFEKQFHHYDMNFALTYGIISKSRAMVSNRETLLGASVAGPMVYQYVSWVLEKACKEKIKKLFFVLRDGYIPKLVADEIIAQRGLPIETGLLFGSRVAWRFPALTVEKLMSMSVWEKSNWIFRDPCYLYVALERLHFSKEELEEAFGKEFAHQKISSFSEFHAALKQVLKKKEFEEQLKNNILSAKENLHEYLAQTIDEPNCAFVDTNSTGKTQADLEQLFCTGQTEHLKKLRFFYHTFLADHQPNPQTQFVFMQTLDDERRFPEALFRAPYNPCYGYEKRNGTVEPIFAQTEFCAWNGSFDYDKYVDGILKFTAAYETAKKKFDVDLSGYTDFLMDVVNFNVPSKDVTRQIAKIPFNPSIYGSESIDFYPKLKWGALLHPFSELIYYPKGSYYLSGYGWPLLYKALYFLVKLKRKHS